MTNEDFASFVDQYADDVYGFCTYLAGNTFERDDLFQDTFLLASCRKDRIDAERNVKSYFLSLAVSIYRNNLRKRKLRLFLTGERSMDEEESAQIADTGMRVEETIIQKEEAAFLRKQVIELPDKYRIPVILFYMEGLSQEEIAGCMRIPVGTVKSRLATARKKLKERMEAAGYDCKVPQVLPGSYEFSNMSVSEEEAVGEGNTPLRTYHGLIVEYQDNGDNSVLVSLTQKGDEEWGTDKALEITESAGEIDGVPVEIRVDNYRLVPPDYQLSEEEKAAVDAGELMVSYGADKVKDVVIGSANFIMDGVLYCITDMNHVSKSQLFEMAKAIIES